MVRGRIWPNFELTQAHILFRYEKDPTKKAEHVATPFFSHYKSMGIFYDATGS